MAALADEVRDRAFERLYEVHVRDVYRYVLAVLRNPADAEDVTQTTFLNAYRAFKAGERPRKPQNWLITIAHNACRTRAVRASRRPREVPLDDVVGALAVEEQAKPNVSALLHALGRLPFNQRAAITMRELEGRPYDEIAETLGVTVPAVEALLVRARRSMRQQSAALRGLVAVQLPRSLRGMFETGDATGGALVGGGVLAKAAAVVVAGVVAGGVGYRTGEAGVAYRSHSVARLEPRAHLAAPGPAHKVVPHHARVAASPSPLATSGASAAVVPRSSARPSVDVIERGNAASAPVEAAPVQEAATPAPAEAAPAPAEPAHSGVVRQTGDTVATVPAQLPAAPALPPVEVPAVSVPEAPQVPALPPVPAP